MLTLLPATLAGDVHGQNKYGWDRLAKLSGMSPNTVKRRILEYEAKLG